MRKTIIGCLVAVALISMTNGLFAQAAASPAHAASAEKNALIADLERIEDLYFKYLSFDERRKALALMDSVMRRIRADQAGYEDGRFDRRGRDPRNVLSDEAFASLRDHVKKELSESRRNDLVLAVGGRGYLTSAQLKTLMETYAFDSYKEALVRSVYPSIVDPVNLVIVLPLINSSITRDEIAKWLAEQADAAPVPRGSDR